MSNLAAYIAEKNAKTLAWVAEDSANRFACTLTEDIQHWASYGVTTPEQLEKYLLACDVYETTKSVWGYKPDWRGLMSLSLEELQADAERLQRDSEAQMERQAEEEMEFAAWEAREREEQAQAERRAFTREEWSLGTAFAAVGL